MYEERLYRRRMNSSDLIQFNLTEYESDLQISACSNLEFEARNIVKEYRRQIKDYIKTHSDFLTSLVPIKADTSAPDIVKHMCFAAELAGVGPMAAVAGAISQYAGISLLKYTGEVILENGGDIYLKSSVDRNVLIYAGSSPFSNKIALKLSGDEKGNGVCTSSGTIGHSLSFGKADAVVVVSRDTLIADAAATSICNIIKTPLDIEKGINLAKTIPLVAGIVIIIGSTMGAYGNVNIVKP